MFKIIAVCFFILICSVNVSTVECPEECLTKDKYDEKCLACIEDTPCQSKCLGNFYSEACILCLNPKCDNKKCRDNDLKAIFGERWIVMKEFYFKVIEKIQNNDQEGLADLVIYPTWFHITIYRGAGDYDNETYEINDREKFIELYGKMFPELVVKKIKNTNKNNITISNIRGVTPSHTDSIRLRADIVGISIGMRCESEGSVQECKDYKIGVDDIDHYNDISHDKKLKGGK